VKVLPGAQKLIDSETDKVVSKIGEMVNKHPLGSFLFQLGKFFVAFVFRTTTKNFSTARKSPHLNDSRARDADLLIPP
jgi:hypothetical protein